MKERQHTGISKAHCLANIKKVWLPFRHSHFIIKRVHVRVTVYTSRLEILVKMWARQVSLLARSRVLPMRGGITYGEGAGNVSFLLYRYSEKRGVCYI